MPKPVRDWRSLKNREELFLRYYTWRMTVDDLDHSHYCRVLTSEMTREQKCWFGFLFGMTYRTPQAYAYWWHFQDFEEITEQDVERWNTENWKRTSYGTDARYNKGHFAAQTCSLIKWVDGYSSLLEKVEALTSFKDPHTNFESLFNSVCEIFKFGRMTSWIACQCLYDVLGLKIDFPNVLVRNPNSDGSMKSIWNGYCMLKGHYDKLLGKQYATGSGYQVTPEDLEFVRHDIMRYRRKAEEYSGISVDVFKWESVWCQFKRLFNPNDSKEYPGHSSGDATSRYLYFREHWPEVDWSLFRRALLTQESVVKGLTYVNQHNKVFGETGLLFHMGELFQDDMPNPYLQLGIDPNELLVKELFQDEGISIPHL